LAAILAVAAAKAVSSWLPTFTGLKAGASTGRPRNPFLKHALSIVAGNAFRMLELGAIDLQMEANSLTLPAACHGSMIAACF
jgi:hypothetical protein